MSRLSWVALRAALLRCARRHRAPIAIAFVVLSGAALIQFRATRHYHQMAVASVGPTAGAPLPPAIPRFSTSEVRIAPGSNFEASLASLNLDSQIADAVIRAVRPVYNLRWVRAGNQLSVLKDSAGALQMIRYQIDGDRLLDIKPAPAGYSASIEHVQYETRVESVAGVIEDSLFGAVQKTNEQDQLALDLADVFGWDIDFYTDTRSGDTFRVLVEKKYFAADAIDGVPDARRGRFAGYGRVLAAEYINDGRPYQAVLYHDAMGLPAYYLPDGRPMKRAFLRSPLKFGARVTSHFSFHRYHPVLRTYREHLGVDYAAPIGTPVQAIGSGTVIHAGWKGGGGRTVILRHANGYQTYYLHLSRILVRPGQRIAQGQCLGLVGMSGLATGPHLDFRIRSRGVFENFEVLRRKLPPADPVRKADFTQFAQLRDRVLPQLTTIPLPAAPTQLASK